MENRIRIGVVSGQSILHYSLVNALNTIGDLEIVGEGLTGADAILLCSTQRPDVLLMDTQLPIMDGITATRLIHRQYPTRIILLSPVIEENSLLEGLRAGAIGFLDRETPSQELVMMIRSAYAGRECLSQEGVKILLRRIADPAGTPPELTAREQEVLALLAKGANNPHIARQLFITRSTVKFHISHILDKLSVDSREEAIAVALRQRLV